MARNLASALDAYTPRQSPSLIQRFERWNLGKRLKKVESLAATLATRRVVTGELTQPDVSAHWIGEDGIGININEPVRLADGSTVTGTIDRYQNPDSHHSAFTVRAIGTYITPKTGIVWHHPPEPGCAEDIPQEISALVLAAETRLRGMRLPVAAKQPELE